MHRLQNFEDVWSVVYQLLSSCQTSLADLAEWRDNLEAYILPWWDLLRYEPGKLIFDQWTSNASWDFDAIMGAFRRLEWRVADFEARTRGLEGASASSASGSEQPLYGGKTAGELRAMVESGELLGVVGDELRGGLFCSKIHQCAHQMRGPLFPEPQLANCRHCQYCGSDRSADVIQREKRT